VTRANEHGQPVGDAVAWTPAPALEPLVLEGRWVRLEPLSGEHADDLGSTVCGPGTEPLWTYLYDDPQPDAAAYVAARLANPGLASLVVRPRGGPASGIASWLREDRANGVVEVGGIIFGPRLQRTTAATEAMWLMAAHAFDRGYRRYEWKCDALNAPSRAAAARLGFTYEGTFRQATVYKDRNRDTAWFSVTDTEWAALEPVYAAWLDPANSADPVAGTGQRTSLSALTARALTDAGTAIPHDGTRARLA
jgi:RimJ/RimL family protein N-acetyltransferase